MFWGLVIFVACLWCAFYIHILRAIENEKKEEQLKGKVERLEEQLKELSDQFYRLNEEVYKRWTKGK